MPVLSLDFTQQRYFAAGMARAFGDVVNFTRGGAGTAFDKAGTLQSYPADVPRYDHDPATGVVRGLLLEGAMTNQFRYSKLSDAAISSADQNLGPVHISGSKDGMTIAVEAVGTEKGVPYLQWRIFGTNTKGVTNFINIHDVTEIPTTAGTVWTNSAFLQLISDTLGSSSIRLFNHYRDAGNVLIGGAGSPNVPITADMRRHQYTGTAPVGTVKIGDHGIYLRVEDGVSIDVTIRVGLPQLEQGVSATSAIITTGSTATRAADTATIDVSGLGIGTELTISGVYNVAAIAGGYDRIWQLDNTNHADRITTFFSTGSGRIGTAAVAGGSFLGDTGGVPYELGTRVATAFRIAASEARIGVNGILAASGALSGAYVPPTVLRLGKSIASDQPAQLFIEKLIIHPRAVSDSELIALGSL